MDEVAAHHGGDVKEFLVDVLFCCAKSVMLHRPVTFKYSIKNIVEVNDAFPVLAFLIDSL